MANLYVRSGGDTGAWTGTYATLAAAAAADSAGDNIYVASDHAETNGAAVTVSLAGTIDNPVKVICGTTAAAPPTTSATSATLTLTVAALWAISGSAYIYGLTFDIGDGTDIANIELASANGGQIQAYEQCTFRLGGSGSTSDITLGITANASATEITWKDCHVKFAAATQNIELMLCKFVWDGGSVESGSTALTAGFIQPTALGEFQTARISSVDLTELGVASYLTTAVNNTTLDVIFRDCKVPAWTTGGLVTGTLSPGDRVEMHNCDSSDTNYRLWIEDYRGSIKSNTSIYNDAGADDGSAQGFSWEMATTANAKFPHMALRSPEIVKWNETVTGTLTATVEIVHDGAAALTDAEIWLEVMCMDPGGTPVGKWQSDRCANLNLNSEAAAQATSTAAWTGDTGTGPNGSSTWNTLKLVVSFTPKEKGYVHARVMLAKASTTVYVDQLLTIA